MAKQYVKVRGVGGGHAAVLRALYTRNVHPVHRTYEFTSLVLSRRWRVFFYYKSSASIVKFD